MGRNAVGVGIEQEIHALRHGPRLFVTYKAVMNVHARIGPIRQIGRIGACNDKRETEQNKVQLRLRRKWLPVLHQILGLLDQVLQAGDHVEHGLHGGGVVIVIDHFIHDERPALDFVAEGVLHFAEGGEQTGAEDLDVGVFLDEAELDAEPIDAIEPEQLFGAGAAGGAAYGLDE